MVISHPQVIPWCIWPSLSNNQRLCSSLANQTTPPLFLYCVLLKSHDWHSNETQAPVCLPLPPLLHTCLIHISMKISVALKRGNEYFSPARPPDSKDSLRYKDGNSSASSTLRHEILNDLSKAWTCSFFGTSSYVWWSNRCNKESPDSTLMHKNVLEQLLCVVVLTHHTHLKAEIFVTYN